MQNQLSTQVLSKYVDVPLYEELCLILGCASNRFPEVTGSKKFSQKENHTYKWLLDLYNNFSDLSKEQLHALALAQANAGKLFSNFSAFMLESLVKNFDVFYEISLFLTTTNVEVIKTLHETLLLGERDSIELSLFALTQLQLETEDDVRLTGLLKIYQESISKKNFPILENIELIRSLITKLSYKKASELPSFFELLLRCTKTLFKQDSSILQLFYYCGYNYQDYLTLSLYFCEVSKPTTLPGLSTNKYSSLLENCITILFSKKELWNDNDLFLLDMIPRYKFSDAVEKSASLQNYANLKFLYELGFGKYVDAYDLLSGDEDWQDCVQYLDQYDKYKFIVKVLQSKEPEEVWDILQSGVVSLPYLFSSYETKAFSVFRNLVSNNLLSDEFIKLCSPRYYLRYLKDDENSYETLCNFIDWLSKEQFFKVLYDIQINTQYLDFRKWLAESPYENTIKQLLFSVLLQEPSRFAKHLDWYTKYSEKMRSDDDIVTWSDIISKCNDSGCSLNVIHKETLSALQDEVIFQKSLDFKDYPMLQILTLCNFEISIPEEFVNDHDRTQLFLKCMENLVSDNYDTIHFKAETLEGISNLCFKITSICLNVRSAKALASFAFENGLEDKIDLLYQVYTDVCDENLYKFNDLASRIIELLKCDFADELLEMYNIYALTAEQIKQLVEHNGILCTNTEHYTAVDKFFKKEEVSVIRPVLLTVLNWDDNAYKNLNKMKSLNSVKDFYSKFKEEWLSLPFNLQGVLLFALKSGKKKFIDFANEHLQHLSELDDMAILFNPDFIKYHFDLDSIIDEADAVFTKRDIDYSLFFYTSEQFNLAVKSSLCNKLIKNEVPLNVVEYFGTVYAYDSCVVDIIDNLNRLPFEKYQELCDDNLSDVLCYKFCWDKDNVKYCDTILRYNLKENLHSGVIKFFSSHEGYANEFLKSLNISDESLEQYWEKLLTYLDIGVWSEYCNYYSSYRPAELIVLGNILSLDKDNNFDNFRETYFAKNYFYQSGDVELEQEWNKHNLTVIDAVRDIGYNQFFESVALLGTNYAMIDDDIFMLCKTVEQNIIALCRKCTQKVNIDYIKNTFKIPCYAYSDKGVDIQVIAQTSPFGRYRSSLLNDNLLFSNGVYNVKLTEV